MKFIKVKDKKENIWVNTSHIIYLRKINEKRTGIITTHREFYMPLSIDEIIIKINEVD